MIDGKHLFNKPVKNDLLTYDKIRKIATGQSNDYTTGSLLDYPYSKEYHKLIAIDLTKEQDLGADPKSIPQINFTRNLDRAGNTQLYKMLNINIKWLNITLM